MNRLGVGMFHRHLFFLGSRVSKEIISNIVNQFLTASQAVNIQ